MAGRGLGAETFSSVATAAAATTFPGGCESSTHETTRTSVGCQVQRGTATTGDTVVEESMMSEYRV
jgi:hypothetical protein